MRHKNKMHEDNHTKTLGILLKRIKKWPISILKKYSVSLIIREM